MRLIPDLKYRIILILISVVHFFAAFIFESYIIDSDFMVNFSSKKTSDKYKAVDESSKDMRCYPKRGNNQTPYQKIESQLRKDAHFWPPITPAASTAQFPHLLTSHSAPQILNDSTAAAMTVDEVATKTARLIATTGLEQIKEIQQNLDDIDESDTGIRVEIAKENNTMTQHVEPRGIELTEFTKI